MLRRFTTASLAIGGLLVGLSTPSLYGQELIETAPTGSSVLAEPVHFAEPAPSVAAQQAIEYELTDCMQGCCPPRRGGWFVEGWLDQGYTANADHPASNFNGPLGFNDRADEYQMNQLYLAFGKDVIKDGSAWDIGFRTDVLYGTDYFFLQSRGLELDQAGNQDWNGDGPRNAGAAALYGLALPQAYAEVHVPVGSGLTAKVGHFYSILGYEAATAPDNFFYSHSYTYVYGEPKTHTGFLLSYNPTDCLTVQAGMTNGWDNFENVTDDTHGFLFGTRWANDVASLSYSMHTGPEDPAGDQNRYLHSLVYTRQLGYRWNYAMQHDYGVQEDAFLTLGGSEDAMYYTLSQYLYYQWSDELAFGGRFEWFRDEDNSRIQQLPIEGLYSGSNYYNVTLGANWKPCQHVLVRPEARYDWSDLNPAGATGVFNDFQDDHMWTFAVDVILYF